MNDGRVLLAGGGEENDLGTNHHAVLATVAADETFELSTISLTKRDDKGALPSHRALRCSAFTAPREAGLLRLGLNYTHVIMIGTT